MMLGLLPKMPNLTMLEIDMCDKSKWHLILLQSLTLAFFGPLEGRTEPLTYVTTNSDGIELCDALALRDHLHQFTAMSENLKKNLKLQFSGLHYD